jgi:hypothetical protein
VEWIKSEQYPWYQRKWWALSSFVILTCNLSYVVGMLAVSISNFVVSFWNHTERAMFNLLWSFFAFLPNFTQNLMLICHSKNWSLIFITKHRNACLISATTSTQLVLIHWNHNWCKLKHAQACLYYDHITLLPLNRTIKSFREVPLQPHHVC